MKVILRKTLLISLALLSSYSIAEGTIDINTFFAKSKDVLKATIASLISPLKPSFLTDSQKELVKGGILLPEGHEKMDSPTARFLEQCPNEALERLDDWSREIRWSKNFTKSSVNLLNNTQMKALVSATHEVIKKEDMISKQGRYSIVHGEKKEYHINQKCFDVLMGRDNLEFVSTRFDTDFSKEPFKQGESERIASLKDGSPASLFAGYSLFSHWSAGENPMGFYIDGMYYALCGERNITPEYIFSKCGHSDIYKRFSSSIHKLDKEYKKICPNHQLLLFSLSPDAIEKTVYPARSGGERRPYPRGITSTTHLLTALKKDPQSVPDYDEIIFCHITTPDYGLHPDRVGKDIKVYTITGADPEKMKAYLKKEKALFDEIKQEIKKKKAYA